jgi:hypothetical protein
MHLRPALYVTALAAAALAPLWPVAVQAAPTVSDVAFVNGMTLDGGALDLSAGTDAERRLGYFSDHYYDPQRNEWWGLSDRGPGGGLLNYETRVQRFTLDVAANGAISNFGVAETIKFTAGGQPLNGLAPNPPSVLGRSFDPEGFVVLPRSGNFVVSDEYGPSLYEFDRSGKLVRTFETPPNLVPKVGNDVNYAATPAGQPALTKGREPNRGLEGLAVSPDGKYLYAMLQNGRIEDGWTANGRGQYTRIVKYDVDTGKPVAQYAYKLESSGQGRGISAIVALGNDRFLVLERNNRGIGVGATLAGADKNVFEIDLAGAQDVTSVDLPASGNVTGAVNKIVKVMDLDANTLAALGGKSPEKWEGLAIGPQLAQDLYLVLAGSDNDYSVTQSGSGDQYDVWFRFTDADPYAASIQCPIGVQTGCFFTTGGAATTLTSEYALLPGVLHAYTARIDGYVSPVPAPATWALVLLGLGLLARSPAHAGKTRPGSNSTRA